MSRFGWTVLLLSLTLAVAMMIVIIRGDQVNLTPLDVAPDPGATAVSTGAPIRIRFQRAMRPQSVEERLTIEPPVEGVVQWLGSTLTFTPRQPLRPETTYTVTLAAGATEQRGRRSRQDYRWQFRTRTPQIVLLQRQGGPANLWLIDPAGGAPRALTNEAVDIIDFSLAPDGGRVVYTRQDSPSSTSLRLLDLQTGASLPFAPDEIAAQATPAWAPDGELIVFERRQAVSGGIANPKLFAARADGGGSNLVYGRGDEVGFGARWAPDGSRLAFFDPVRPAVVIFNFTRDLVVVPVQTTVAFAWAPDGRRLVIEDIVTENNSFRHVLLLADAQTGQARPLSSEATIDEAAPAWSPDGDWLAFTRKSNTGSVGGAQPWLRRIDGGEARPLLPAAPEYETVQLRWSPDGRQLLLSRLALNDAQGETQLWLVEPGASSTPRQLGSALAAAWRP